MKKLLSFILMFMMLMSICGCEDLDGEIHKNKYDVHTAFNAFSKDDEDKYAIIDAFRTDDGRYYYLYDVGFIDAAPISIDNSTGVYYSGGNTELSLTMKKGTEESINRTVTSICSRAISIKNSASSSSELAIGYAKLGAAISSECTNSVTQTFENSVSQAKSETQEFSQTVTHAFRDGEDPIGFYCYTSLASIQLYELVIYDSNSGTIESAIPYALIGKSFPGLIYSKTSFFNCTTNKIDFDLNKVEDFPYPDKLLSDKVTVEFDLNGGSGIIEKREYRIGDKYGELPIPSRHGQVFDGWKLNGNIVTSNSVITSNQVLVADWQLNTTRTYTASKISAQNSFGASKEMDTTTIQVPLQDYFDIESLKKEGYSVRFTIKYDVKIGLTNIGSLKYEFWLTNGSNTIYSFNDKISNKTSRTLQTGLITEYEGVIFINLYTANIQPVELTNFSIAVEFAKP